MPKLDPFRDKRKKTEIGGSPKQAVKQRERKRARDGKRVLASTKRLKEVTKELTKTERKLAIKEHMLALASSAPSPAEMRKLIWATFQELGFNPLTELVQAAQEIDDPKDRATVLDKLASMVIAKPKSVDIQAELKGDMTITLMDFSKVTQKDLKEMQPDPLSGAIDVTPDETEDYSEFVSEEDLERQRREEALDI